MTELTKEISSTTYPGRGIVIGRTPDGTNAVAAYFIMGRSANSRNRIFTEKEGEVFTEPFDESLVQDPSLIIYAAIRQYQNHLIVTNGNRRGLLLPDLEGVDTIEKQIAIARQKAGIAPEEPVSLERFEVIRHT